MSSSGKMLILCLIFGYSCLARTSSTRRKVTEKLKSDIGDYLNDDDYSYNYDDSKPDGIDGGLLIDNNDATLDPPYFDVSAMKINARVGEDVILNCDVRNFKLTNLVMWYKNKNLIINGQISLDKRINALKNNSITINSVQFFDAGDYFCTVLPENIRFHITLSIDRRLAIFCDSRDVTEKSIILRQGENHTLECKTYVSGYPIIKWYLNGKRVENLASKIDGGKIFIENFDVEHSGIFQCLGDDGSNNPPHGMVKIDVHYTPKVSTHRHHINTEPKTNADIYCDYRADPIAVAQWKKNGQYIQSFGEKYSERSAILKAKNQTILTVKSIESKDLGEYECEVKNSIGSNEIKFHLIYEPEIPQFENMEVEGRKVTLYWLVRSMQPLSEAILDYKIDGSYTWSSENMIHTQKHSKHTNIWKLRHQIELAPGFWQARVKTKNTVGWSKFSAQHNFKIDDDEEVETVLKNSFPPGTVMAAGMGRANSTESSSGEMLFGTSSYRSYFISAISLILSYLIFIKLTTV